MSSMPLPPVSRYCEYEPGPPVLSLLRDSLTALGRSRLEQTVELRSVRGGDAQGTERIARSAERLAWSQAIARLRHKPRPISGRPGNHGQHYCCVNEAQCKAECR